jgi:hypothetical protein
MRGKWALATRLLLLLVLIVAAVPLSASAPRCAKPVAFPRPKARPAMPCCAARTAVGTRVSCCAPEKVAVAAVAKANAPCSCEVKSAPAAPAPRESVASVRTAALLSTAPVFFPPREWVQAAEPGIVGVDAGPPPDLDFVPDLGRAPPPR